MLTFRRKLLLNLFKLSDAFILVVVLLLSSKLSTYPIHQITLREFFSLRIRVSNFIILLCMGILWYWLFYTFQLYRSRRLENKFQEWKDILKAASAGTVILALAGFTFRLRFLTPYFVLLFWIFSTILTISFRSLLRSALKVVRVYGRNLRIILIVGTNERAYDFARMIEERKTLGYHLLGFIDKKIHIPNNRMKFLGGLERFSSIIKEHILDEVFIALPIKSCYEDIQQIVQKAEDHGIVVRYLSHLFNTKVARLEAERVGHFSMMTIASGPQESWPLLVKRMLDLMFGFVLLVLAFPVMAFAALAVKLTSSGPIFFRQKRVGRNRRIFDLYKFRTMVADAEKMQTRLEALNEVGGPVFKIKKDPRVTAAGRWLRKWSVDELPQLFNVIKGDMSLVGPRPLPIRDYNGFDEDWQQRRFSIPPGITCTWQIDGRNDIPFEDWMKLDMEYIDNWKLSKDFKILLRTIPAVLRGKGM